LDTPSLRASKEKFTLRRTILLISVLSGLILPGWLRAEGAKDARHLLLPYIGYQFMNGEQVGASFYYSTRDSYNPDTLLVYSGSYAGERSVKSPVFGLLYRYRFNDRIHFEGSLATANDGKTLKYPVAIQYYNFNVISWELTVQRRNTVMASAGASYDLPIPKEWLGATLRAGVGYAWRKVKVKSSLPDATLNFSDAERMLTAKAGIDVTFWSQSFLVLQGGVSYTRFMPTKSGVDPFGGIGWQFSVFPVWSE
jgi:hypothetical protein